MANRNHLVEAAKNPSVALDYEIAQEIASSLGRLGRKLEQALADLAAFDAETSASGQSPESSRTKLIAAARSALWNFIVQRESCGLRDARQVMLDYRVPPEVQAAVAVPPVAHRRPR